MLIAVPHCQEGTMRLNIKPKQKSWYVMVCTVGLSFRQDVTVVILQLKFKPFCHISVPLKTAVQSDSVTLSSSLCWSVPRGHYLVFPTKYCFLLPSLSPLSYLGWKDGAWPRTSWRSKKCHSCFTIWDRHCFRYLVIVVQRAFESLSVLLCSNSLNL